MNTTARRLLAVALLPLAPACLVLATDTGEVFSGDISSATTFKAGPSDCDVSVTGTLKVKAALTVEPGATVCMDAKAAIVVDETGSLRAEGTAAAPITFKGVVPTPGSWKGIQFTSTNSANSFSHVTVQHAGNADAICCGVFVGGESIQAAVVVGDSGGGGLFSLEDSSITDSAGHGVFFFPKATVGSFARNTFTAVAKAPVAVPLSSASKLDAESSYGAPVRVLGDKLQSATTLKRLPVAYGMSLGVADTTFNLVAALTVEAGARLEFEANSGIVVEEAGSLLVNGTADKRVVITGRSATPGFWKGIGMLSLTNSLAYADVSYGGNAEALCCGFFEGNNDGKGNLVIGSAATKAGVSLSNVTSTNSASRGVNAMHQSTVTQSGTNDFTTGNAVANAGI